MPVADVGHRTIEVVLVGRHAQEGSSGVLDTGYIRFRLGHEDNPCANAGVVPFPNGPAHVIGCSSPILAVSIRSQEAGVGRMGVGVAIRVDRRDLASTVAAERVWG